MWLSGIREPAGSEHWGQLPPKAESLRPRYTESKYRRRYWRPTTENRDSQPIPMDFASLDPSPPVLERLENLLPDWSACSAVQRPSWRSAGRLRHTTGKRGEVFSSFFCLLKNSSQPQDILPDSERQNALKRLSMI